MGDFSMGSKLTVTLSASLCALAIASPASAADLGSGFSVTGGTTLVSDYRFRGISQTDKRFAIQGTFSLNHKSGFYATVWASSIDDYVAAGSNAEIDLIGGYRKTFGNTTVDVGVLYYYYPGSHGVDTDFVEPYASVAQVIGPVTAKLTANYSPKQSALTVGFGKEDNLYLAGDLSAAIPKTPIGLTAHLGHSYGPSYLTIGRGYTDWSLGATLTYKQIVAGLAYVDTNKDLYSPRGRNISGSGIVASLGVSF